MQFGTKDIFWASKNRKCPKNRRKIGNNLPKMAFFIALKTININI